LTAIPLAFLVLVLLSTYPGWHQFEPSDRDEASVEYEVKPFPAQAVAKVSLGALVLASLFSFISVLVQHIVSATGSTMVETLSYGTVKGKVGSASMVLGWAGALSYVIVTADLWVFILAMTTEKTTAGAEDEPLQS
jgi:hypothetical protein